MIRGEGDPPHATRPKDFIVTLYLCLQGILIPIYVWYHIIPLWSESESESGANRELLAMVRREEICRNTIKNNIGTFSYFLLN